MKRDEKLEKISNVFLKQSIILLILYVRQYRVNKIKITIIQIFKIFFFKVSSCLCIELTTQNQPKTHSLNDQMNILITHLCDDEDTQQVRSSIQNRYEQLMSIVDSKIQTILLEHQSKFFYRQ